MHAFIPQETIEKHTAWWDGTNAGPLTCYTYRKEEFDANAHQPSWMVDGNMFWAIGSAMGEFLKTDDAGVFDDAISFILAGLATQGFLAEGYPSYFFNLGPGSIAAHITDFYHFNDNTVWFELDNAPMDFDAVLAIDPEKETRFDEAHTEVLTRLSSALKGRAILSSADLGGIIDIIASLRTSNNLLMDTMDKGSEMIDRAAQIIERKWKRVFEKESRVLRETNEGYHTTWMTMLADAPITHTQCDFGAMISPAMFKEFVVPSLRRQYKEMKRTVFHLDGPSMVAHLPHLLAIEELHAIQWVSGAGAEPIHHERWHPLYKDIIDAGKKVVLIGFPTTRDHIANLFKKFPKDAFFLQLYGENADDAKTFERECMPLLEW